MKKLPTIKNKQMNIFIILSPLQLLNAIEARETLTNKHNDLLIVIYTPNKRNSKQIDKILDYYRWENIKNIYIKYTSKELILQMLILAYKFLRDNTRAEKLFLGEFRLDCSWMLVNNLDPKETILLDDGVGTLNIFDDPDTFNKKRSKKKDRFFKLFGLKNCDRSIVSLFTMFGAEMITKHKVIPNKHSYIKNHIQNYKIQEEKVFFFGAPLVELSIIEEFYFHEALQKIVNEYPNKQIIYVMHRREEVAKIQHLFPSIEFLRFENIAEVEFFLKKKKPSHIASFYSATLFTLSLIYDIKKVDVFLLDVNKINEKNRLAIQKVYDLYQHKFNVIKISQ